MRVAITASPGRLASLDARLEAAGFEAVRSPLVRVSALPATAAAAPLIGLAWRLYPSRSAVEAWVQLGLGFGDARLGAVGPGTADELARAGGTVAVVGSPATAAGLAHAVLTHPAAPSAGDAVGVVQGDRARPTLVDALRAAGIEPRVATVYTSRGGGWTLNGAVDAVVLASPSAVAALPPRVAAQAQLVAIGPTTAAAIARRGWSALVAEAPSAAAVAAVLERWRAAGAAPEGGR
jgi:uroporphyrinogen-III synthase